MFSVPWTLTGQKKSWRLARLDRRQHLGGQIVDHVVGAEPDPLNRLRVGDIGADELGRAIMRQVAVADVGDDDLVAVGDQLRCKMAADEPIAAENHMSH
jgi:hypothetical protein